VTAFQLCNGPGLFFRNGIRKAGYNYADFAKEWRHFYEVIKQQVPNAPFAGPDTAFNNEWLVPFAREFKRTFCVYHNTTMLKDHPPNRL
jgi:hypothetical protein